MGIHPPAPVLRVLLLLGVSLLAACPSEPQPDQGPESITGLQPRSRSGSAMDSVDVVSPEEALDRADQTINESNVIDELNSLEGELGDN